MSRTVIGRYVDPLAEVWLGAARRIGLTVVRTPDAYAHTDGRGRLAIGDDATLDADDSLGQMIFHELCHSLIEGEDAFAKEDWGMDNTGPDHDWREHACLRLQFVVCARHGLGEVFAPTTDFRAFWDTLRGDVLADRGDRAVIAAIAGLRRVGKAPWAPAFEEALAATAAIATVAHRFAAPRAGEPATLWLGVQPTPAAHPTGLPPRPTATDDARCGTCAWRHQGRGALRCRQAEARVDPAWPACERYEADGAVDCQTCGACCREAYHSVEVGRRDPMRAKRPDLVVDRGTYLEVRRDGDRCACLEGGAHVDTPTGPATTRFRCTIYDDRPRTCRDFTLGSAHCLTARRRVGLSL